MRNYTTVFVIIVLAAGLLFDAPVFAQNNNNTISIADLQALIDELKTQIESLQARITRLEGELSVTKEEFEVVKEELQFTKVLRQGVIGNEVRALQRYLAQDKDIYPEGLITGYFGPLTGSAVKRFQKKHAIVSSGSPSTTGFGQVGSQTRAKLNELVTDGAGASRVIPPGLLIAPGLEITTTTVATTTLPEATSTIPTTTSTIIATSTPPEATSTESIIPPSPPPSGSGGGGGPAPTAPSSEPEPDPEPESDTTPPVISNIQTTNITENSATIIWSTEESTNSRVDYASTSPVATVAALNITDSTSVTDHNINLLDLMNNSTYYYVVVSADESGNTAMSSEQAFTTLLPPEQQCEGIVC